MEHSGPDIVVTADGRRLLAVEVKARRGDVRAGAAQLSRYMERLLYPTGLLVTDDKVLILRRDYGRGTIELVGPFDTMGVDALRRSDANGLAFEADVQRWLESLRDPSVVRELPEPLQGAIAEWVVPEIDAGEIRAAGPRAKVARSG